LGSFPTLGILGGLHHDSRKLQEIGEPYRRFVAETSFFPGVAVFDGRQGRRSDDMPWVAIAIGTAATVLLTMLHPMIFGGSPLG
jgi:uncharacterized membrane protein